MIGPTNAYQRAFHLYELNRHDEAIESIESALKAEPDDAYCLALLGVIYSHKKKTRLARKAMNRALAMNPEDHYFHYMNSVCWNNLGNGRKSKQAILTALSINPARAVYHVWYARILKANGAWRKSLDEVDVALNIEPDLRDALSLRTEVLTMLGRKKEAEANSKLLLHDAPDIEDPHADAGFVALSTGNTEEAFARFREALRINPDSERAREGVLTALRSRYLVYRWFYAIKLQVLLIPPRLRGIVFLLLLNILPRSLASNMEHMHPDEKNVITGFLAVYAFILIALLLVEQTMNLLLIFHPLGRLLLRKDQKLETVGLFASIAVCLTTATIAILIHSDRFGLLAVLTGIAAVILGMLGASSDRSNLRYGLCWGILSLEAIAVVLTLTLGSDKVEHPVSNLVRPPIRRHVQRSLPQPPLPRP